MNSIWTESVQLPCFESLEGKIKTDVLIIGGGIAGILCAYFLQDQGIDYLLAEGRTICFGTTRNTTAKITSQHGLLYENLLKNVGMEQTKMYLDANQRAVDKFYELCRNIDCDFEEKPAFLYSVNNRKKLENEAEALGKIGFTADVVKTGELPFETAGALRFEKQAQFHPLKFIAAISRNLRIFEHTFVTEFRGKTAITEKAEIDFQKLIIASHFPINNKHGLYFLKMYQDRSYIIALRNAGKINGMYLDAAKGGLSFRSYKDYLLLGGGSHRTGKSGSGWNQVRNASEKYYPFSEEAFCWAAQDCMTLDGLPYIGPYSANMRDCFVAAGFNKWGMTSSMVAAMILSDHIMEKENPYAKVFSPSRSMIKQQLFINSWEALANLMKKSKKRCPHLGCSLKWNSFEHSWDCPCHGSRFDEDGHMLDNPANGDIKW
ncbi:MAG: FAD-dependent oxidoreductase [Blautia sp.]|nr:FAD-dependent oxidoreductase [Blautia sp.]